MDIEKLVESVRLCGSTPKVDQCKQCAYWSGGDMSKCIPRMTTDAATTLSTLQEENDQLRAELEYEKEHANAYYEECGQWEAENTQLKENWRPSSRIGMPLSRTFAHLQNSGGRKIVGSLAVGANLRDKAVVNGK